MKKIRFLSALLCLALLVTTLAAPALADDNSSSGLVLNKTAVYNADNKDYTITLEAYATGSKVITSVSKDVPTDIVLVLDQSGSMADKMGEYVYTEYTSNNSILYNYRKNGGSDNLWYKREDGSYVSVSVKKTPSYQQISNSTDNNQYSNYSKQGVLYDKDKNVVTVTMGGFDYSQYKFPYTYTFSDGTYTVVYGMKNSPVGDDVIDAHMPFYTVGNDDSTTVYTYSYTVNGQTTTITTSTGKDSKPDKTFYSRTLDSSKGDVRLDALMTAAKTFANSVATKAAGADGLIGTDDDINHRIAVVGFASNTTTYYNTELLTGVTITTGKESYGTFPVTTDGSHYYYPNGYRKLGVQYGKIADADYKKAFQSMDTDEGKTNVTDALNALTAHGGTQTDHGIDMANEIFKNNPIPTGETRNRVVIVFTDGIPTGNGNDYDDDTARKAIQYANTARDTYGATVYTIGIFSGADATKAGSTSTDSDADKGNYVCQQISNNKGTPQSPSYYLSAADASSLNNIFQQIADQIQGGSVSTTLGSSTVIKDIIAPQFELPDGTDTSKINVYTAECNGVNEEGVPQFKEECESATDVHISITGSVEGSADTVSVTGFDFSENWCGAEINNGATTYRGKKLIIEFTVKAKDAFLGGNDVYTNTSAGVYANYEATEPVQEFNRPQVNVPIKDVTVTAADKNVYLLGSLTGTQIKEGTTIKSGNVELKLGEDNYGLEDWQNDYVTIDVTYTDADGNTLTDMNQLTDDTTYTITATVTPKTITPTTSEGVTAVTKTGSATQKINVFKPELTVTFKDNTVDYKSSIDSTSYVSNKATLEYTKNNLVSVTEVWKHDGTDSKDDTMIGEEPTLDKTYTYSVSEGVESGKVTSTTYVPVKAVVATSINGTPVTEATTITFAHQCEVNGTDKDGNKISCEYWNAENMKDGDPAFLLHVDNIYANLTITKTFAEDVTVDEGQSFLFHVSGPDFNGDVIIVGSGSVTIENLTIGEYTVTEDTGWSWRYTPVENGKSITLVANEKNEVTIENRRDKEQWLDGNTHADNLFKADGIDTTTGAATN